jgi:hypothetical protein
MSKILSPNEQEHALIVLFPKRSKDLCRYASIMLVLPEDDVCRSDVASPENEVDVSSCISRTRTGRLCHGDSQARHRAVWGGRVRIEIRGVEMWGASWTRSVSAASVASPRGLPKATGA